MSNESDHLVKIDLTPEYKRNLRELSKKYRKIRLDTQPVIEQIQAGNFYWRSHSRNGRRLYHLKSPGEKQQHPKRKKCRISHDLSSRIAVIVLLLTIYSKSRSNRY